MHDLAADSDVAQQTVSILIGNSDNRLSQEEWSSFARNAQTLVSEFCAHVFFAGGASWDSPWQNACWVAEVELKDKAAFLERIRELRQKYRQDSVAVVFGKTEFVWQRFVSCHICSLSLANF